MDQIKKKVSLVFCTMNNAEAIQHIHLWHTVGFNCTQSFVARSTTWSGGGGGVGAKSRLCFFPSIASSNCYINMTWQIKPLRSKCSCPNSKTTLNMAYMCMIYMWPYHPKQVTLILFMKFWFLHTCTNFHFKWYQDLANQPTGWKLLIKINLAAVESSILRNWAEKICFAYNSITAVTI